MCICNLFSAYLIDFYHMRFKKKLFRFGKWRDLEKFQVGSREEKHLFRSNWFLSVPLGHGYQAQGDIQARQISHLMG
jgi:hypothetical protein